MNEYPRIDERTCGTNNYISRLEIPSGRDIRQNAWLTITLNYSLNFIDSQNPGRNSSGESIILQNQPEGYFVAVDSDGKKFPIRDWDSLSKQIFHEKFKKGESFWNHKFFLETPSDYADLDFKGIDGWIYRPNVICLFRLHEYRGSLTHKRIDVVRAVTERQFRSNENLYNHTDVGNDKNISPRVLWHELGHAINQSHIQNLLKTDIGSTLCVDDVNHKACYVTPPWLPPNVMGHGTALHAVNAKPWLKQIEDHTNIPISKWNAKVFSSIPPRRIRPA